MLDKILGKLLNIYNNIGDYLVSLTFTQMAIGIGIFTVCGIVFVLVGEIYHDYQRCTYTYTKDALELILKDMVIPLIALLIIIVNKYPSILKVEYIIYVRYLLLFLTLPLILMPIYIIKYYFYNRRTNKEK